MGERIRFEDGRWIVSDRPVIPFIEGDGTGPDIWRAARRVFDAAVEKTARGKRRVEWLEILAGEDRKSTRLNSSHGYISYAVFCLKKKKKVHIEEDASASKSRLQRAV